MDPSDQVNRRLKRLEHQLGNLPVSRTKLEEAIREEVVRFKTKELQNKPEDQDKFDDNWDTIWDFQVDDLNLMTQAETQRRTLRMLVREENNFRPEVETHASAADAPTGGGAFGLLHDLLERDILFATSRTQSMRGSKIVFTHDRSNEIRYGTCTVRSAQTNLQTLRLDCEVIDNVASTPIAFKNCKKLVVFVPGYNQSFEQAIDCTYKLRHLLEKEGLDTSSQEGYRFAAFSWPARGDAGFLNLTPLGDVGRPFFYWMDAAACEGSESCLQRFIAEVKVVAGQSLTEIHFVAHSMGCRLLLRALTDVAQGHISLIKSVTFAAPDADRQMFTTLLTELAASHDFRDCRFLLLVNNKDIPVRASQVLHNAPRAGVLGPRGQYTLVNGCFIVDSSNRREQEINIFWEDFLYWVTRHFDFLYLKRSLSLIRKAIECQQRDELETYLNVAASFRRILVQGFPIYEMR